ncbi:hypothetical protein ACF06P_35595 [Streptomyces sp. NPDC015684]|uniref:hypothetical protein n=1 Tax=Streptomyces sp. NPDC015684 TaxID=3364963 RepID=UPI0036FAF9F7
MNTFDIPAGPVEKPPAGFVVSDEQAAVLRDTLTAAGIELGEYEREIVTWLSRWEWATVATIVSWVARAATSRPPAAPVALPGRFDATPADVDRHLRRILADDVHLRYQQTIGVRAVSEAAKDVRLEVVLPDAPDAKQWREAADFFDPAKAGVAYPKQLQCSRHNGFGPCPGAPDCTPREDT